MIDARCGSVGSSVKEFNPGGFVENIGGAIVLAIHQYDLPLKSLLAWASVNNSEFVYGLCMLVWISLRKIKANFPGKT